MQTAMKKELGSELYEEKYSATIPNDADQYLDEVATIYAPLNGEKSIKYKW